MGKNSQLLVRLQAFPTDVFSSISIVCQSGFCWETARRKHEVPSKTVDLWHVDLKQSLFSIGFWDLKTTTIKDFQQKNLNGKIQSKELQLKNERTWLVGLHKGIILPSYIGIIVSHCKESLLNKQYSMESRRAFFMAQVTSVTEKKIQNHPWQGMELPMWDRGHAFVGAKGAGSCLHVDQARLRCPSRFSLFFFFLLFFWLAFCGSKSKVMHFLFSYYLKVGETLKCFFWILQCLKWFISTSGAIYWLF